MSIEDYFL